jgi:hypothetical protein
MGTWGRRTGRGHRFREFAVSDGVRHIPDTAYMAEIHLIFRSEANLFHMAVRAAVRAKHAHPSLGTSESAYKRRLRLVQADSFGESIIVYVCKQRDVIMGGT